MQDIFDILDEKYIDTINDLPFSEGHPSISWQDCPCNVDYKWGKAWVDIVGFRNLTSENNTFYVNDAPETLAIIRYGYQGLRGVTVSWKPTIRTYQSGNNVIAELTIERRWYEIFCGEYGCYPVYHSATMTISDSEPAPLIYPLISESGSIKIIEYNNTVNPRTEIKITSGPAFIKYIYNGDHISHYKMVAHVEKTPKGVYFANVSYANIWTTGTGSLRQMNDKVIIPGTADPDYQNLAIQISNIYTTENAAISESITRDTYGIERSFSGLYLSVIMIFSVMFGTLYYTVKRVL